MANKKPRTVQYRRKREKRTNYAKRLKLLLSGEARVVVRLTNQKVIAQIVKFHPKGDLVLMGVESTQLRKFGWDYAGKSIPSAYLTGYLLAKKAIEKGGCGKAVIDTGFRTLARKGRVTAFVQGVVEGGLEITVGDEDIFPSESRLKGEHIQKYASGLKKEAATGHQFTKYLKNKVAVEKLAETFEKVKAKIK